jgi:stage II sporulation protein D
MHEKDYGGSKLMKISLKPIIVLISAIFVVTLLIPTLIVIPYSEKASGKLTEEQQTTNPEKTQIASGPTVDVAVYRTNLKQIENVPLEEYVIGVLASEMPADFEIEALKAQALAARTYIFKTVMSGESEKLDSTPDGAMVKDTVDHQVYKNKEELKNLWGSDYNWKIKKITEAVNATQGQILTFDGSPIEALFFSTSNGYTENSEDYWTNEIPYLRSVESPWDEKSKKFHGQVVLSVQQVEQKLEQKLEEKLGGKHEIELGNGSEIGKVTARTESNRVASVEVDGKTLTGVWVREALGLKSSDFSWERKGDQIIISTKGYGHGVGMSQYGANFMAEDGKKYDQILAHYYQGVQISSADQFIAEFTAKK